MSVHPQHSLSTIEALPRIGSHKKILRPPSAPKDNFNSHQNQNPTNVSQGECSLRRPRSHSQLNSLSSARKALQSANSSQAVKLEATTLIILKKTQQLQKQDCLIEKQIQTVKKQIEELRIRQKFNTDLTQIPTTINSTVSSRLTSNLSKDPQTSKLKNMELLRKKIDLEHEKYKKVSIEVDKARREIQTMKKINSDLEVELSSWQSRMDEEQTQVSELENKINSLNQAVQNKKIETVQQKAHLIRDYDAILKKLDQDLKEPGGRENSDAPYFYLTENVSPANSRAVGQLRHPSPKNHKNITLQTTELKQKAQKWTVQLNSMKQKLLASSEEQLHQKLKEKHLKNYDRYEYLNSRFSHLEQLKRRNQELKERKTTTKEQYGIDEGQTKKGKKMIEIKERIKMSKMKKMKQEEEINKIEDLFFNLKFFILNFGQKTGKLQTSSDPITKDNLLEHLEGVLNVIKAS